MTPIENRNWCFSLRKMTSSKLKGLLLRVAHGDIYSNDRLFRFGMRESPECTRCGNPDSIHHKTISCHYTKLIWKECFKVTDKQRLNNAEDIIENKILGAMPNTKPLVLTIHAEILRRILGLKDDATYLVRPKHLVLIALKGLLIVEKKNENKNALMEMIEDIQH